MSSPVGIRVAVAAEFADGHFFPTVFGSWLFSTRRQTPARVSRGVTSFVTMDKVFAFLVLSLFYA